MLCEQGVRVPNPAGGTRVGAAGPGQQRVSTAAQPSTA